MDLIKKELEKIILRVFRLEADVLFTTLSLFNMDCLCFVSLEF